ncbi:MAG: hypothetical protein LC104_03035 [Bacteroidales bacterium]|nr:hypothetical protein [Bacteroidales bacterium]
MAALRDEAERYTSRDHRQDRLDRAEHRSKQIVEMEKELAAIAKRIDVAEKLQATTRLETQLP